METTEARPAVHAQRAPVATASSRGYRGVLLELGFVVVAVAANQLVRWHTLDHTDEAVGNARDVLALERLLGLDWEHAIQDATLGVPVLGDFLTHFYVWGYLPALFAAMIWLYVRDWPSYRFLRNALLGAGVVGLLVYAFYPCAPPWIAASGFTDTIVQSGLTSVARPEGIANHVGALPSFHCAYLILPAVVVFRSTRSRVLRVVCVVHPALMGYAIVATGNHWVLDIPAGIALAGVGLLWAGHVSRRRPIPTLGAIAPRACSWSNEPEAIRREQP